MCLKEINKKIENSSIFKQTDCNIRGIKGPTALSNNLDILKDVAYDYMHLCCEGYIKRFIKLIFTPPNKKRILKIEPDYYIGRVIKD